MTDPGRPEQSVDEPDRVVIRDKRKIDPTTGEARPVTAEPAVEADQVPLVEASLLDERTADLQRVQAEYANYRKRAERDRLAAGEAGVSSLLAQLLPVLDDIDRARTHGDVTGPFEAIVGKLDDILEKIGLQPFGDVGDPFDPNVHEAVMHTESADVSEPTCTTIMRKGYKHNERMLRPAMVGVSDPANPADTDSDNAES